jgi:hypothetical protein
MRIRTTQLLTRSTRDIAILLLEVKIMAALFLLPTLEAGTREEKATVINSDAKPGIEFSGFSVRC